MISFGVLDFGSSRTIQSQDYDRIVKIAANITALVKETVIVFSVSAIGVMYLRLFLAVLLLLASAVNKSCRIFSRSEVCAHNEGRCKALIRVIK